ncbi:MAG: hypothetical protein FWD85_13010 [Microbacteriaceae bacterium]|nr:hypothetical protein [Microbacteriaceae bacterium]MCL2796208.1 hypothetical protein [Microbacteriaceae bacterium]
MTDQNPFADDDTVLTEGHGTMDDTAPVRRTPPPDPAASIFRGRALPPQAPPVTDIHLLEFRPPETPSGTVARYRPRADVEVAEIPDFDAEWRVRQRTPRDISATDVVAHQLDDRRTWRRRATLTVTVVAVVALVAGVVALWVLARLP